MWVIEFHMQKSRLAAGSLLNVLGMLCFGYANCNGQLPTV